MSTQSEPRRRNNTIALALLTVGSLLLIFGSVYLMKELAVFYGIGVGAAVQSISDRANLSASVVDAATSITTIRYDILESYVLSVVALGLTAAAFAMFIKRNEKITAASLSYTRINAALVIIYMLLMYLVLAEFYVNLQGTYLDIAYVGIIICLGVDVYIEYAYRKRDILRAQRPVSSIALDPTKPFSNILTLQDSLFSAMSGHLRVLDKHFNSGALENLHRLTAKSLGRFTRMTILTSKGMLDSEMGKGISDFRSELSRSGIGLEVRLMDDGDVVDQHERIILDDSVAYKVPPINIINTRSEHVTRISYRDARKRFDQLYQRGIKIENYFVKQARDGNSDQEGK